MKPIRPRHLPALTILTPFLLMPLSSCAATADETPATGTTSVAGMNQTGAKAGATEAAAPTSGKKAPVPFGLAREVTVAADGSGDFKTVQSAVDAAPDGEKSLWLVRIKPGIYREKISIPATKGPIKFLGENSETTVLSFGDHAKTVGADGKEIGTFRSASTTVSSDDFAAQNITFDNSAGPVGQAVAFRLDGDRGIFRNCRFTGWQDTLLLNKKRAYLENCFISGHVDFIFGASTAFFQNCEINVRGTGYLTAASTPQESPYGYVFANCRITSADPNANTYLGRPWRPYGAVIFLETEMSNVVRPEGWENWRNPENEKTARYSEWRSTGDGANGTKRVSWARPLSDEIAATLIPPTVLDGWDPNAISEERLASLPDAQRKSWESYLVRSDQLLQAEKDTLAAETNGQKPIKAYTAKDFKIKTTWEGAWYASDEAKKLTEAMLSFQTPTGGWSKAVDYTQGPRKPGMQWTAQESPFHYAATIDNRATTEQINFLNQVYAVSPRPEVKKAIERGLDYLFTAQYPNGGWPQNFPLEGGYHDAVTYNDNAMVHVMQLFDDTNTLPAWSWLDAGRRAKAKAASTAALGYVLKSQYVQNGVKTVWCAQHDPIDYAPVAARLKEPASLSGGESVEIVRYLMDLPQQTEPVVASIEAALNWFDKSKITDMKVEKREGKTVYVRDDTPQPPLWARFYALKSNAPIFAGAQDGVIYTSFEEMAAHNHFGYDYFVDRPLDLITKNAEKWRKKRAKLAQAF